MFAFRMLSEVLELTERRLATTHTFAQNFYERYCLYLTSNTIITNSEIVLNDSHWEEYQNYAEFQEEFV